MWTFRELPTHTNTTLTYFLLFFLDKQQYSECSSGMKEFWVFPARHKQQIDRMTLPAMMSLLQYVLDHLPFLSGGRVGKQSCSCLLRYWKCGLRPLMALLLPWKRAAASTLWCCYRCGEAVSQKPGEVWWRRDERDVLLTEPQTQDQLTD